MEDWDRKSIAAAAAGAVAAVGLGWLLTRKWREQVDGDRPAPALSDGKGPGWGGDTGAQRSAGIGGMRDPPKDWSRLDERVDESFPASDPPGINPHVD